MLDKPEAAQLLDAVAAFLDNDVIPAVEGRKRFHALVAANVLRIVAREVRIGAGLVEQEIADLWGVLGHDSAIAVGGDRGALVIELSNDLCRRIESGEADAEPWRSSVGAYLERSVARRLEIDNPKLLR